MIKKYLFSKFSRPCSSSPDAQNYLHPGAVHALGASLTFRDIRSILHGMDLAEPSAMQRAFLLSLLFYAAGLIAALAVTISMKMQRQKFRHREVV